MKEIGILSASLVLSFSCSPGSVSNNSSTAALSNSLSQTSTFKVSEASQMESQLSNAGLSFKDIDCLPQQIPIDSVSNANTATTTSPPSSDRICRIFCEGGPTPITVITSSEVDASGNYGDYEGPCCEINGAVDSRFQCTHPLRDPQPLPPVMDPTTSKVPTTLPPVPGDPPTPKPITTLPPVGVL